MEQSVICKGGYWDSALTERFFCSLKYESHNHEIFKTKAVVKLSVVDYLAFYNDCRSHSALSYLTPVEFGRFFLTTLP